MVRFFLRNFSRCFKDCQNLFGAVRIFSRWSASSRNGLNVLRTFKIFSKRLKFSEDGRHFLRTAKIFFITNKTIAGLSKSSQDDKICLRVVRFFFITDRLYSRRPGLFKVCQIFFFRGSRIFFTTIRIFYGRSESYEDRQNLVWMVRIYLGRSEYSSDVQNLLRTSGIFSR